MQRYHPANCTSAVNNSAVGGGGSSGRSDSSSVGNYSLNSRYVQLFSYPPFYMLIPLWRRVNTFFLFTAGGHHRWHPTSWSVKRTVSTPGTWFCLVISLFCLHKAKSFEPLATLFHLHLLSQIIYISPKKSADLDRLIFILQHQLLPKRT